jgi:Metal-dependent hydrolases of the beta-lactamase superfamily I
MYSDKIKIPLTAYTLFSGSSGNSIFVTSGTTSILIDAGRSARAIETALLEVGCNISRIDAIYITHEHTDHISALEIISKKHKIPVHMTDPSADRVLYHHTYTSQVTETHPPIYSCQIGDLSIQSFPIPHDSAMNVGYIITSDTGEKLGIATDIGYVTPAIEAALLGCEQVILESNHDIDMLLNGPYPPSLKQRILSPYGHLSNANCAELVCKLAATGTKSLTLAHLSRDNNLPALALNTTIQTLSQNGHESTQIKIQVAPPDIVTLV